MPASRWHCCPHCSVYSMLPENAPRDLECKGCGKPMFAQTELAGSFATALSLCEFDSAHEKLSEAQVVPDASICVQCGMCTYNCPMGIDVRAHAWRGKAIRDSHCLTCSECVNRCPRGVLRFERIPLFVLK